PTGASQQRLEIQCPQHGQYPILRVYFFVPAPKEQLPKCAWGKVRPLGKKVDVAGLGANDSPRSAVPNSRRRAEQRYLGFVAQPDCQSTQSVRNRNGQILDQGTAIGR